MKQKHSLILDDEFLQYCKLNKIEDIEKLAKEIFQRGFTLLKYGDTPMVSKMVANEIIPPIPLKPPDETGPRAVLDIKKDTKEDITEPRSKNKSVIPSDTKNIVKTTQKELYDE